MIIKAISIPMRQHSRLAIFCFNFKQAITQPIRLSSSTKTSAVDHLSSQAAKADPLISQLQQEISPIKDHATVPPPKSDKPAKKEKKGAKDIPVKDEIVDIGRLDLRIGRIQAIDKHPNADTLYVEQIDLAEDKPRTIVSGLVKHVKAEDLKDHLVMVLCNVKPANMRGVASEGMVLCASSPDKMEVLIPPQGSVPGDKVICQSFVARPDVPFMKPNKKIFEQVAPDLKANDQGVATYKGIPLEVEGKGVVKAPTMTNCQIK